MNSFDNYNLSFHHTIY